MTELISSIFSEQVATGNQKQQENWKVQKHVDIEQHSPEQPKD